MGDQPHANEEHQETPVTEELSSLVGLLTLGQFDQIIVMLQKMQVTDGRVPDPSSVALLKTASHLASMCQQLTQSIDKNYQAWQESVNQQQMLQDQLADILTLLKQQETAVIHHQPPVYPLLQTTRPPPATFWQKLRTLFGQPTAPPQTAPPPLPKPASSRPTYTRSPAQRRQASKGTAPRYLLFWHVSRFPEQAAH